jgi:quercetin dioxygenase-like cupin family protein
MRRRMLSLSLMSLIFVSLLGGRVDAFSTTISQPSSGCITGVTVERLASGLPSAVDDMALTLLRITFAPGSGMVDLHTHPGALVLSIESGELGYSIQEGEVEIQRATTDGTPGPMEPLASGEEATLRPGDSLFEEGLVHSARNTGDVPAVVLVAGLMAADEPFTQCAEGA